LVDKGESKRQTHGDYEGELPAVGSVFFWFGYPFRCVGHIDEDDEAGEPAGIVVDEAPPDRVQAFLKPGVEEFAQQQYALSTLALPGSPAWEDASALQRWSFRGDADNLTDNQRPPGRH
jgi:hypothetical protein